MMTELKEELDKEYTSAYVGGVKEKNITWEYH
jgi:hypothetical protein